MSAPSSSSSTGAKRPPNNQDKMNSLEIFEDDVEGIFQKLCAPDAFREITPSSVCAAYNRRSHGEEAVKSEEKMQSAFKRFHEELLGTKAKDGEDMSVSLTSKDFLRGVQRASELLLDQPENEREQVLRSLEGLALSLTGEDPKVFADLLDLPAALLVEDIKALMLAMK